jgi:hypothetical protein
MTSIEERDMKKAMMVLVAVVALAGGTLMAANIDNLSGQSCGGFSGNWHFVNNQTGGAPAGTLNATWSSGDTCTVGPSKITASTQHFNCTASGELVSASTGALPGKLVLSDFTCETKEPPKCDPKTDPTCKP